MTQQTPPEHTASEHTASDVQPRPHLTGWLGTVLGTPDPRGLARFYSDLLGWPVADEADEWCTIALPGARANLAFQLEDRHERPTWPPEPGRQQMMMHLDIGVHDLDEAVRQAQVAGAELAGFQPQDDVRVMIDPAGHPFCLYVDEG